MTAEQGIRGTIWLGEKLSRLTEEIIREVDYLDWLVSHEMAA